MKNVKILRIENADHGTYGVLSIDGHVFCLTLERPWLDNKFEISCIPCGEYECRKIVSPRFGETFEVMEVPGRSGILFHAGNDAILDSHGCILLGASFSRRFNGIENSRPTIDSFMSVMENELSFTLEISSL